MPASRARRSRVRLLARHRGICPWDALLARPRVDAAVALNRKVTGDLLGFTVDDIQSSVIVGLSRRISDELSDQLYSARASELRLHSADLITPPRRKHARRRKHKTR